MRSLDALLGAALAAPFPASDPPALAPRTAAAAPPCSSQHAGSGSISLGSVSSSGFRPSTIASTMSGASSVSRSRLPRYPRSIRSTAAISLIEA